MIDHENQVFTAVATALRNEYGTGNIFVTGEYVAQPPKFPAVMIVQMDNDEKEAREYEPGDLKFQRRSKKGNQKNEKISAEELQALKALEQQ